MYYSPLKKSLNAFDSSLLLEKKSTASESEPVPQGDLLSQFDPEFVNEKQFVNLINSYIMPSLLGSEIKVNDLVVHIKDNFAESQNEKNTKMEKVNNIFLTNYHNMQNLQIRSYFC